MIVCRRVPDYDSPALQSAVEEIFGAWEGAKALSASARVLLKPNLLAKHAPEKGVTTHPAVVRAVIEALCARGVLPQNITVADSPGGVYNETLMRSVYRVSGLEAVCRETGAQLYTACRSRAKKADGELVREFTLIEPVHEADVVIDLPKLKTHVMTGMTCAVKNLFGTVPGLQKAEFHMRFPDKERFGGMLVDLCETVRPALVIADGVLAMEGDGPAGGTPRNLGVVLGGNDPYEIDLAVCRMMNLEPSRVPYLAAAQRRGLCAEHLDASALRGDADAAAPVPDFKLPESYTSIDFSTRAPRAVRWLVPGVEKFIAPRPVIERGRCIGCGKCAEICPQHTIALKNGRAHIDPSACIRCFCCHEMCPVKAIAVRRFGLFKL